MAKGDTIHHVEEFNNFPWDELDMTDFNSGTWALTTGGGGLRSGTKTLERIREDCTCDRWVLPDALVELLEYQRKQGERLARSSIQSALGL